MKKRRDVHGGGTRKTASRRKELALALCVSLWMAGGSVAGAADLYLDAADNEVKASTAVPVAPSPAVGSTATDKKLSVTGGDWSNWYIYGGYSTTSGVNLDGYRLTLSGVKNMKTIVGAYTNAANASATNNYVTATDCTGTGRIYGGQARREGGKCHADQCDAYRGR